MTALLLYTFQPSHFVINMGVFRFMLDTVITVHPAMGMAFLGRIISRQKIKKY